MSKSLVCALIIGAVLAGFGLGIGTTPARATPIAVQMTTTNGTVPGTTTTYTITDNGNGGARNIFPSAQSANGTWSWTNGFPEFLSYGPAQTLTVTFSAPVPVSDIVFGLNSTSWSTSTVSVSGGTASTSNFNMTDGLPTSWAGNNGEATWNAATGTITSSLQDLSIMIGSNSGNTITTLTVNAGASASGTDGYTVFVGFLQAGQSAPEPSSMVLLATAGLGLLAFRHRARR